MFSEYASRFLQQSQTRMSAIRDGRLQQQSAPLFFSTNDHAQGDVNEEAQDIYALKSSRRFFGRPNAVEEDDEDGGQSSSAPRRGPNGLRSSWKAGASSVLDGSGTIGSDSEIQSASQLLGGASQLGEDSMHSKASGKGKMVDVGLDESERLGMDPEEIDYEDMVREDRTSRESENDYFHNENPPTDFAVEVEPEEYNPPSFQDFRRPPRNPYNDPDPEDEDEYANFMPKPTPHQSRQELPTTTAIPQQVSHPPISPPVHDMAWSLLYAASMGMMFATAFVVWLHTDADDQRDSKGRFPFSDTIYHTLNSSVHLLAVDTVIAVAVSLVWMWLLRNFVTPLIYLLIFSVPVIMTTMSIYPMVWSYSGPTHGHGPQDKAMRWTSLVPAAIAIGWTWMVWRGRNALERAVSIIQFACKILGENPSLLLLSFGTLVGLLTFTWVWFGMFTRVFLSGKSAYIGGSIVWIPNKWSWGLGGYFIFMYLWTLGVASGLQRATSAATVSQWYFHRHALPNADSHAVLNAALQHSITTLVGSICFSSFSTLMVRVPIVVLPRRFAGFLHLFFFNFIASPISALTHPLTLTYSAIHSVPLLPASRKISGMRFIDTSGFSGGNHHPRTAYKLAKMLLSATRAITAFSMGMCAWVVVARNPDHPSGYAYLVGMIAGAIGWGVLGVTEGCLGCIVDAGLVCLGSETGQGPSYCREAQIAYGG